VYIPSGGWGCYLLAIDQALSPADAAHDNEALRLYDEGDAELLRNRVDAERNTRDGPDQHHRGWQSLSVLGAVVAPDLRHQVDTPTDRPDRTQDVRGERN
jgi:hypothetical protein